MMRRPLLFSLLLFLGVGAAAWWLLSRPGPEKEAPFFRTARPTPDTLFAVYRPDTTVLVQGGETGWRILAPVRDAADPVVVEALIKRLREIATRDIYPLLPEKLDSYGFRHPRGALVAAYAGSTPADTLWFGASTLGGSGVYVRNGSRSEVGVLPSDLVDRFLLKTPFDFRRIELLRFHPSRAARVRSRDAAGRVVSDLVHGPGGWRLREPYPGPASRAEVERYLETLSHLTVERFLAEEPGPDRTAYGLDSPAAVLEVLTTGGDSLRLALGKRSGFEQLYAEVTGRRAILGVSERYLPAVLRDSDGLREPAVFRFGLAAVDSVLFVSGERVRSRTPDRDPGVQQDVPASRRALEGLVTLRAERFDPYGPRTARETGLGTDRRRMVWLAGPGDTLAVVERGRVAGGLLPVRVVAGSGARPEEILWVPAEAQDLWDLLGS